MSLGEGAEPLTLKLSQPGSNIHISEEWKDMILIYK